jgi:hypothetical protein
MAHAPGNAVPLLARLASGPGLLRDLAGGATLLAAWLFLWCWFALAAVTPARLPAPPERAAAVATAA